MNTKCFGKKSLHRILNVSVSVLFMLLFAGPGASGYPNYYETDGGLVEGFEEEGGLEALLPLYYDSSFEGAITRHISKETAVPVPEPATIILVLTGFGIATYRRRKRDHRIQLTEEVSATTPGAGKPEEQQVIMIGKMTQDIVHDIKNALAGIRTCADVLGDATLQPAERKEFAHLIIREIDRATDLTQELLEFTCESQDMLDLELCSIQDMVDDLLAILKYSFASQKIVVQTNLAYTGTIWADVPKMKRVLMNIADNARDAMPDGGTFTIASRQDADHVYLEFTDDGCGIPSELQSRMFEPLVTQGKAHGTGLGMAIVKRILDAHKARIDVESVVSEGTTIRIVLPIPEGTA